MLHVAILSAILQACATTTASDAPTEGQAPFCTIAQPILWSVNDTAATIEQIKEHNADGIVLCEWTRQTIEGFDPPKKSPRRGNSAGSLLSRPDFARRGVTRARP